MRGVADGWLKLVKAGDLEAVKEQVESGIIENVTFPGFPSWLNSLPVQDDERSPLMLASELGHAHIVAFLIAKGGLVNYRNSHNVTAMMCAVVYGREEIISLLRESGATFDAAGEDGVESVGLAAQSGTVDAVDRLAELGAPLDMQDVYGNTPQAYAEGQANEELAAFLQRKGVWKNKPSREERGAALRVATKNGDFPLVKRLVASGAHPNVWGKGQYENELYHPSTLLVAFRASRRDIAHFLLEAGAQPDVDFLCRIAEMGDVRMLRHALRRGAALNTVYEDSCPLSEAARAGHLKMIRVMFRHGAVADPSPRIWSCRYPPLYVALKGGHERVALYLLSKGACANEGVFTPLGAAAASCSAGIVKRLLDLGADVNREDKHYTRLTALMSAAATCNTEAASLLLARGAKHRLVTSRYTPLHVVDVRRPSSLAFVNLLLDAGHEVNCIDAQGATPLAYIVHRGNTAVISALLRAGKE